VQTSHVGGAPAPFPSLSLSPSPPFFSPSFPPSLPSFPFSPLPPLASRPPYCGWLFGESSAVAPLAALGELKCSPDNQQANGSRRSPAAKRYLVNFRLKISPPAATIFRSFSGNETSNWGTGWTSSNIGLLDFHAGLPEVWGSNHGGEKEISV